MLRCVIYILLSQFTQFCKLFTIEINMRSNKGSCVNSSEKCYKCLRILVLCEEGKQRD